jgi:hypothetical protein
MIDTTYIHELRFKYTMHESCLNVCKWNKQAPDPVTIADHSLDNVDNSLTVSQILNGSRHFSGIYGASISYCIWFAMRAVMMDEDMSALMGACLKRDVKDSGYTRFRHIVNSTSHIDKAHNQ